MVVMQFESWVERQIREAMERGEFDDLPGAGKPLELSDDPDWWIKSKIARENLEPMLPTPLALRREVANIDATVADVPTEDEVRAVAADLNQRIRESYLRPAAGPTIAVGLVDVEAVVQRWRAR
jgi:DnaJ homologue, subfamily C, member 28, conserved domain